MSIAYMQRFEYLIILNLTFFEIWIVIVYFHHEVCGTAMFLANWETSIIRQDFPYTTENL